MVADLLVDSNRMASANVSEASHGFRVSFLAAVLRFRWRLTNNNLIGMLELLVHETPIFGVNVVWLNWVSIFCCFSVTRRCQKTNRQSEIGETGCGTVQPRRNICQCDRLDKDFRKHVLFLFVRGLRPVRSKKRVDRAGMNEICCGHHGT